MSKPNETKPEATKTKRARKADPVTAATKALKAYRKATAAEGACKALVEKLDAESRALFDSFVKAITPAATK